MGFRLWFNGKPTQTIWMADCPTYEEQLNSYKKSNEEYGKYSFEYFYTSSVVDKEVVEIIKEEAVNYAVFTAIPQGKQIHTKKQREAVDYFVNILLKKLEAK